MELKKKKKKLITIYSINSDMPYMHSHNVIYRNLKTERYTKFSKK